MTGQSPGAVELGIAGISEAEEIGAGGFGVVYRAVEEDLGRTVAVKVLTGNLDEGARQRFERERRAMGRLSGHPNIVTIYRGGYTERGNAYLVMEFLNRGSLAERLAKGGPLPWQETLTFAVQLSGALETAHRAGVLHRDIKPGNILLSALGNAKLCDFGIARLQGAPETRSSVITASLAHAPPDIVSGSRPDPRSDVYSLASTMFELVAATPPFVRPTDESMVPILARIAQDPVPELPSDQLPPIVHEAISSAMAKDPDDRPNSAAEFGALLVEAQRSLGLAPTPIPIEDVGPEGSANRHVPFPEMGAGPLPAPNPWSPHETDTGPPQRAATSGPTAEPTIVTGAEADRLGGASDDPARWAPPVAPDPATSGETPRHQATTSGETVVHGSPTPAPLPVDRASTSAETPLERAATSGETPSHQAATSGESPLPQAATSGEIVAPHPPTEGAGWARPDAPARPPWFFPAIAAAVVAVIGVIAALALSAGDDGSDDDVVAGASSETSDTDGADAVEGGEGTGDELGSIYDDVAAYTDFETIVDDSGSISLEIPVEWVDRTTSPGRDDVPLLAASPLLEGGLYGGFDHPGVQVAVVRRDNASLDEINALLEQFREQECEVGETGNVQTPYVGRFERLVNCGGTDTTIVRTAFFASAEDLLAVMYIQVLSDADVQAATRIRNSLRLTNTLN